MTSKDQRQPANFTQPLYINGLHGRMMHVPAIRNRKREILLVYGHHATLERCWGLVSELNKYGAVTVPDLPGFGGMTSLYKIGKRPTIENFADYLAAFVKLRFKRKRITVVGIGFGFVVATKMLQLYPHIAKKVDIVVSISGFAHKDDLSLSSKRRMFHLYSAELFSRLLPSVFYKNVLNHPVAIKLTSDKRFYADNTPHRTSKRQRQADLEFRSNLKSTNHARTYNKTIVELLRLDNCQKQIDLPLHHVHITKDKSVDKYKVEQHLRVVFNEYFGYTSQFKNVLPVIAPDKKSASTLLPAKLRKILSAK